MDVFLTSGGQTLVHSDTRVKIIQERESCWEKAKKNLAANSCRLS